MGPAVYRHRTIPDQTRGLNPGVGSTLATAANSLLLNPDTPSPILTRPPPESSVKARPRCRAPSLSL